MKPRFSNTQPANTVGRVTAGQEIFANTSYYYASEVVGQTLGTGNGSTATFSGTLSDSTHRPLRKGTIQVTGLLASGVAIAVDDKAGGLSGTHVSTGTIDYDTGAVSVTFDANVTNGAVVVATYAWNSETEGESGINEIEFDMSLVPVQAKIHPLKFKYSVPAGLAASAHLAVDVQDTLAELAGQFMKMERDNLGVKLISDNSPAISTLNFTATPSTYYDRQSLYVDIELKLNEAESTIQNSNGRGGVNWVLCGQNAANIFRNSKGFQPANVVAPIAHLLHFVWGHAT
jgi:hypothetical protein